MSEQSRETQPKPEVARHPCSSAHQAADLYQLASADGVRLTLADGRQLIDGMASQWCAIHGYNHPVLKRALTQQLAALSPAPSAGQTHPPAIKLAQMLVELAPAGLDRVVFSDSESVALEMALEMALQHCCSRGKPQKRRLVALGSAYHDAIFSAIARPGPGSGVHQPADPPARDLFAPDPTPDFDQPCQDSDLAAMADLLHQHHREIAAVVVEPVVQVAGALRFYSSDYLVRLRALCDAFDIVLIFDETATSLGRTGKLFASEHAGVEPDILCLGGSLTGGYVPLAAALCSEAISSAVSAGDACALEQGSTFTGSPLACATAIASIELLLSQPWQRMVQGVQQALAAGLAPAAELEQVADVRTLGGIGVIELHEPVATDTVQPMLVERGVWVRPCGNLVYATPPFIMNAPDIAALSAAMVDVVGQL